MQPKSWEMNPSGVSAGRSMSIKTLFVLIQLILVQHVMAQSGTFKNWAADADLLKKGASTVICKSNADQILIATTFSTENPSSNNHFGISPIAPFLYDAWVMGTVNFTNFDRLLPVSSSPSSNISVEVLSQSIPRSLNKAASEYVYQMRIRVLENSVSLLNETMMTHFAYDSRVSIPQDFKDGGDENNLIQPELKQPRKLTPRQIADRKVLNGIVRNLTPGKVIDLSCKGYNFDFRMGH